MAMLVCSAQKCVYNDGMYCSKGDIKVGGENATRVQETCCTDFTERTTLRRKSMLHVKPVTVYTMMNTNARQVRSVL